MSVLKPDSLDPAGSTPSRLLRAHLEAAQRNVSVLQEAHVDASSEAARKALNALALELDRIAGVIDKFDQPRRPDSFPPAISFASGAAAGQAAQEPRILVAEDDPDLRSLLADLLSARYDVALAPDGKAALEQLQRERFHLAIVDVQLPGLSGFDIAERLRERAKGGPPQTFMFLSGQSGTDFKVRGLALGAADYVTKPFDPEELLARVARILATAVREESLRADAFTDSLTGLANYRSFTASLEREFARSQRYDQPLCLLTVDLDHLKSINDSAGHQAGNEAIRRVAQVLKDGVRSFEIVARQGGDEFGVLLPNTAEAEAVRLSERLRAGVAAHAVGGVQLSISVGIASRVKGSTGSLRELIKKSDEALYQSKRAGRNRISAWSAGRTPPG